MQYNIRPTRAIGMLVALAALVPLMGTSASAYELPTIHLRKATTTPQLLSKLDNPSWNVGWVGGSPTWFGFGGDAPDRTHTEVIITYDDAALYVAFMNLDRSTVVCPRGTMKPLNTVDSNGLWIETPQKRRFYFMMGLDNSYPAVPKRASGEFPSYDQSLNKLTGWQTKGWFAGNLTIQGTAIIPWSTMYTTAPTPGSVWRINLLNYNQTSTNLSNPTIRTMWTPGGPNQPTQWGYLAFDESPVVHPDVSPEAVLTFRPASGYGDELTLRAGNSASKTTEWADEAITQSSWGDWDPVDYTIKEYMQYDLSMIPSDRTIISAVVKNHYRGNFTANPRDLNLHVVRLDGNYDPATVTMRTSPAPVENSSLRLVKVSEGGKFVDFDVTDAINKALARGQRKVAFALAGTSGDLNNGKIWDVSRGRADWYNGGRPRLVVTFGKPGMYYSQPVNVGSTNYTSVATTASKNKLTNGTFQYGTVEGITNSTYWMDPGYAYVNGQNVPYLVKAGDVNTTTGHTALRFMTPISWKSITQKATGLIGGHTYTFSGWYRGAVVGHKADVRLNFKDASGNSLGSGQAVYSGSGKWERITLTRTAPAGTAYCQVDAYNWNSGTGSYMLYSDFQLEEGTKATTYSETMGAYYPDYPRTDGMPVAKSGILEVASSK